MSLKAGGVGLNLTAASNVFLMVTFPPLFPCFSLHCAAHKTMFLFLFDVKICYVLTYRIRGGIPLLRSRQSCGFIDSDKSGKF